MATDTCLVPGETKASWLQRFIQWVAEGEKARRANTRAWLRVKTRFDGRISWPDGTIEFRGIDLHHAGVGAKTWKRLEPGITVFVHLQTYQQMGFAVVRHCTWRGLGGYHVGLEFRTPTMRCDAGSWQVKQVKN